MLVASRVPCADGLKAWATQYWDVLPACFYLWKFIWNCALGSMWTYIAGQDGTLWKRHHRKSMGSNLTGVPLGFTLETPAS